jgi:hypothetical protein
MKKRGSGRGSHGVVAGTVISQNFLGHIKKAKRKISAVILQ